MSLESEIKNLSVAISALVKAVGTITFEHAPEAGKAVDAKPAKVEKPKKGKAKPKPEAAPHAIEYSVIKAAALKLAQTGGRDALVAVLDSMSLKTASAATPEQYPELLANLQRETKEAE